MAKAVEQLDFETAALIRDELYKLEGTGPKAPQTPHPQTAFWELNKML